MLLPYLQENAADYAHERKIFKMKKIIAKHQQKKIYKREALNLWLQHFAEMMCVVW